MGRRLLAVSNLYPPHALGGFERDCAESVERISALGNQTIVLTGTTSGRDRETDRIFRTLPLHTSSPHPFGLPRELAWHVRSRAAAAVAVRRSVPDVVSLWGTSWISRAALATVAKSAPTVAVVYDYGLLDHLVAQPIPRREGWRRYYDGVAGRGFHAVGGDGPLTKPGRFVFCSEAIRRTYEERLGPLPGAVIPHGVSVPEVRPLFSIREDRLRVGAVGRLVPEKGFDVLIEAAMELATSGDGDLVEIEIRGTAPEPAHHAELLSRAETARRSGAHVSIEPALAGPDDVAKWMLTKDCIAMTSVWEEPGGLVAMEAMAAGRAVVSTAAGGLAELVEDGVNAIVVPKRDARALASALRLLARDPVLAERIAAAGFQRVRLHHRIEDRGPELDEFLLSTAGAQR